MNRFKIFYDAINIITYCCSCHFIVNLYHHSENALQSSYNKSDAKRHSTLRNSKINPSKTLYQYYFLG